MKMVYSDLVVGVIGLAITVGVAVLLCKKGVIDKLTEIKEDLTDFYVPEVLREGENYEENNQAIAKGTNSEGSTDDLENHGPDEENPSEPK